MEEAGAEASAAADGGKKKKRASRTVLVKMDDGLVYFMSGRNKTLHQDCRAGDISRLHLAGVDPDLHKIPPQNILPLHLWPATAAITDEGCVHIDLLKDRGVVRSNFPHKRCRHSAKLYPKLKRLYGVCENCKEVWVKSRKCFGGVWHLVADAVEADVLPHAAVPSPLWPLFRACVSICDEPWTQPLLVAAEGNLAPSEDTLIRDMLLVLPDHVTQKYTSFAQQFGCADAIAFAQSLWRLCGSNTLSVAALSSADISIAATVSSMPGSVFRFDHGENHIYRADWREFADMLLVHHVMSRAPELPPDIKYDRIYSADQLAAASAVTASADGSFVAHIHIISADDITLDAISCLITQATCRIALTFDDSVQHIARYIQYMVQTL